MSRFRPNRLYASIEADRIALVRVAGRGELHDRALVPLDATADAPESSLRPLADILAAPPWRGLDRRVVVSDRLARYLVVERPEGARSVEELRLACTARFESSFDTVADEWELSIDLRPFTTDCLVCAMPRRLLEATRAVFAQHGRLRSLRPYLISELRRCDRTLTRPCWFAASARDSVAVAALTRSSCHGIRVAALESPSAAQIAELVTRQRLLVDEPDAAAPAFLTGVVEGDVEPGTLRRIDRAQWRTLAPATLADYRIALSEIWT